MPRREFEDGPRGSGQWTAYDIVTASVLTAAAAQARNEVALTIRGNEYVVNLREMTQTRSSTGFVRTIRTDGLASGTPSSGASTQMAFAGVRV